MISACDEESELGKATKMSQYDLIFTEVKFQFVFRKFVLELISRKFQQGHSTIVYYFLSVSSVTIFILLYFFWVSFEKKNLNLYRRREELLSWLNILYGWRWKGSKKYYFCPNSMKTEQRKREKRRWIRSLSLVLLLFLLFVLSWYTKIKAASTRIEREVFLFVRHFWLSLKVVLCKYMRIFFSPIEPIQIESFLCISLHTTHIWGEVTMKRKFIVPFTW